MRILTAEFRLNYSGSSSLQQLILLVYGDAADFLKLNLPRRVLIRLLVFASLFRSCFAQVYLANLRVNAMSCSPIASFNCRPTAADTWLGNELLKDVSKNWQCVAFNVMCAPSCRYVTGHGGVSLYAWRHFWMYIVPRSSWKLPTMSYRPSKLSWTRWRPTAITSKRKIRGWKRR